MAQLHRERVVEGGAVPRRWLYALHGIFGAGRNWGSIIRRVVRARPEWGALLIDLRQHGASQGFAPPHTIQRAAEDLLPLAAETPPSALLGHSFGGKVALLLAAKQPRPPELRQLWVIDSTPDARPPAGSAWQMLQLLQRLPDQFDSRDELMADLAREGIPRPTAQWMATNLHAVHRHFHWRFDRDAMEGLLLSFFETDAWAVVERPPPDLAIHFVRATRSSVLDEAAIARVKEAGTRADVHLHDVEGGHWLNADNPDTIVQLLVENLPA